MGDIHGLIASAPALMRKEADNDIATFVAGGLRQLRQTAMEDEGKVVDVALELVQSATGQPGLLLGKDEDGHWKPQVPPPPELVDTVESACDQLPHDAVSLQSTEYGCFVPIAPGGEGILVPGYTPGGVQQETLDTLCHAFSLASAAAIRGQAIADAMDEISGLQSVASATLSARELQQVLSCATHETLRLLSANICGVFLREGEEVVMKCCVGNLRTETANLRMKRGEGVAGRVFETGEACRIHEYIRSNAISQHFFDLARLEHAHSALAAPLKIHGEVVGVLEVWRRRKSTFSDRDVRRMIALANLISIAIENANLNESQEIAVRELASANKQLHEQNGTIVLSSEIQQAMLQSLLSGEGLDGIVKVIERYTKAEAAILTADFQPMTNAPISTAIEGFRAEIIAIIQSQAHGGISAWHRAKDCWIRVQAITVSGDNVGWLCACTTDSNEGIFDVVLSAGSLSAALCYLENQAAIQARAEVRSEILWDILEGPPKVRQAAIAKARTLRIELMHPHRLLHCSMESLDEISKLEGWSANVVERNRRILIQKITEGLDNSGMTLSATRGNTLVALIPTLDADDVRATIARIQSTIHAGLPSVRPKWGVSSVSGSGSDFRNASREATIAVLAAAQLGVGDVAISEELGVLGVLLSARHDCDLTGLVGSVLGEAAEYDQARNYVLAKTVRAYFDEDCSLQQAAAKLHVHEKTVRYRLTQFERMSGMDLRRHDHRVMIDLALRMQLLISKDSMKQLGAAPSA